MFSIAKRIKKRIKRERDRIKFLLTVGHLEAKTEVFKSLFPRNVQIKRVATGFNFTEGPIWFAEEKHLLISDIPDNKILKLTSDIHRTTYSIHMHPVGCRERWLKPAATSI